MSTKPIKLIKKTYLVQIKNSLGTKMFRNFYIKQENKIFDATDNGELSCAFYVSGILTLFGLIKKIHGTVESTEQDLNKSGWKKINKPRPGSVIIWEKIIDKRHESHKHIGFYIGSNQTISNSSEKKQIIKHDWTFDNKRKVESIYWKKI